MKIAFNNSTDLLCKSMDWFLYDGDIRHVSVKTTHLLFSLPRCKKIKNTRDKLLRKRLCDE